MKAETVSALDGDTFVVSDLAGNVEACSSNTHGLFHQDTRYLTQWTLFINGLKPVVLSVENLSPSTLQFLLAHSLNNVYVSSTLAMIRGREVKNGLHEDLTVFNHGGSAQDVDIKIEVASDFADLFEVKDRLPKKGSFYHRIEDSVLYLGYRREEFVRETKIFANQACELNRDSIIFRFRLGPQSQWTARIDVEIACDALGTCTNNQRTGLSTLAEHSSKECTSSAPILNSSMRSLGRTYARSIEDLAALRFFPPLNAGDSIVAAGLPWFMAVFGRDSLIASFQALPFAPNIAKETLRTLAHWQGVKVDNFREEEPGKIPHELRWGELTAFEERPHSPYYGSHDSTPLFLILLDEYERWTGDRELIKTLEVQARAALRWIDDYGDGDGDGYLEYERKNHETGLENQCWKDSWDSIIHPDGTLAQTPRACCEIQGYVYDAKMRCARLSREIWGDLEYAEELELQARALKKRFNRDFWVDSSADSDGHFVLALDGKKNQVKTLASNIGHLLWSGIVAEEKASSCMKDLMGDKLFNGWGIRTLAEGNRSYNPIGYHTGTVWPHDTALIALGLRRYGFRKEAAQLSLALLQAAEYFGGRLPEAFAGYPRALTKIPVEYPTACSPQAWASGAPLLLIRTLLGLDPLGEHIIVDPAIPEAISRLELLGIPGRWGHADAFGRGLIQ
jgi:glycogen debranching enzyme